MFVHLYPNHIYAHARNITYKHTGKAQTDGNVDRCGDNDNDTKSIAIWVSKSLLSTTSYTLTHTDIE